MVSDAKTVKEYLASLDNIRQPVITKLDNIVTENLSGKYSRNMQYGIISYTIPHYVYPGGYHCKPTDEVPYMSIASQKNHVALYHMGIYFDNKLEKWLRDTFKKNDLKIDLGKSCLRFKKPDQIPYDIITELVKKSSIEDYLEQYKKSDPRNKK